MFLLDQLFDAGTEQGPMLNQLDSAKKAISDGKESCANYQPENETFGPGTLRQAHIEGRSRPSGIGHRRLGGEGALDLSRS